MVTEGFETVWSANVPPAPVLAFASGRGQACLVFLVPVEIWMALELPSQRHWFRFCGTNAASGKNSLQGDWAVVHGEVENFPMPFIHVRSHPTVL
jgi:hypothetical protein